MTLAKATVTGTVYRTPETRYTQNDIAVSDFTLKIDDEREEMLVRVISKRKSLAEVINKLKLGSRLMVDGRLQTAVSKTPEGVEKKFFEIDANDIEIISGETSVSSEMSTASSEPEENIVKFEEFSEEEKLIDEDEIPF